MACKFIFEYPMYASTVYSKLESLENYLDKWEWI